jgi:outer membrane protein OmpA-like peptidoglycan-associated protein
MLVLVSAAPARATIETSLMVFFATGSAEVRAIAERTLNEAVRRVREERCILVVHGNTDTAEVDFLLSRARAEAVKDRLLQMGVAPERIQTEAHGADRLLVQTGLDVSRAENRRAEIVCVRK